MSRPLLGAAAVLLASSSVLAAPKKKPAMEVGEVAVTLKRTPFGGGGSYLEAAFDVTVHRTPAGMVLPEVKAACRIGGKKLVDSAGSLDQLNDVESGETVRVSASPFAMSPLAEPPSVCDLTLSAKAMFGGTQKLGQFCFADGEVKPGPCPKP